MCDAEIPQENQGWVLVPPSDGVLDRRSLAVLDDVEVYASMTKCPTPFREWGSFLLSVF